jgi:xanthine/uracil/vitamin C permease (AzgA family)
MAMDERKAAGMAWQSLLCFLLATIAPFLMSHSSQHEIAALLVPGTLFLLGVWMGCRAFIQSPRPRPLSVWTAGIISALAILAGIAWYLLMPELAK